jgi:Tol biopolymer transport system component
MTCEWVEGKLSAYLDDALDPQIREDVGSHIERCAHCQSLLNDYRHDEQLLRALPTAIPDDRLRERIFDSPEYAALTRRLAGGSRPARTRALRTLLPAAALIALALGAGFFALERFSTQGGSANSGKSHTIGAPSSFAYPLAPGQRVLFARDGALWSAPETPTSDSPTASAPQQLTPTSARVAAWSVAPASGSQGGRLVAWVDGKTGALHLVRADGLTDVIVAQLAPAGQTIPQAALDSLAWSPDGSQLAFASVDASGALSLRIITVVGPDTTSGAQISAPITIEGLIGEPVWSANSQELAWVATNDGSAQSVWALRNGAASLVAPQADPADSQATVARLGWRGNSVSWATQNSGEITGVFGATPGATSAARLTPTQARYTAAALSSKGEWLLAGQGVLWRITSGASSPSWAASLAKPVSQIIWTPDGKTAALLAPNGAASAQTSRLSLWSPVNGLSLVSSNVASDAAPAWSKDGKLLAYVAGGQAVIAHVQSGHSLGGVSAGDVATPASLAWSPDSASFAITDAHGVYLATSDGQSFTLISSRTPDASALVWSTAG